MAAGALLMPRAPAQNDSVCSTPACIQAAQAILADVNLNVDPCSDFYQYTCGSWLQNTAILEDRVSNGTFEALMDDSYDAIKSILEGTYDDLYKNLTESAEKGFNIDNNQTDKTNFDTIQSYYNLCMDEDTLNKLGPTPIYPEIAQIENELFPVNDTAAILSANSTHFTQVMTQLQKSSAPVIASVFVFSDDKNPKLAIPVFDQPTLTLPSKEYYSQAPILDAYRTGLTEVIYKVLGDGNNGTQQDGDFRTSESNKTGFQRWSLEKTQAAVGRYVDFETKLANISVANEDRQVRTKLYNIFTLFDFQAQNSFVDWSGIVNSLIPSNGTQLADNARVNVWAPEYFQKLNTLLSSNVTLQTLQEYFVIQLTLLKADTLDKSSRDAYATFKSKISGAAVSKDRWRECVKDVSATYRDSVGRYYVLQKFGGEAQKEKVEQFITTIHDEWKYSLEHNGWLDNQTKTNAIEKVNLISHRTAYSSKNPDLRDPSSIRKMEQPYFVNKTSFFDTKSIAIEATTSLLWEYAGKEMPEEVWFLSAQTVNAVYEPNTNSINVPAGILHPPFFDFDAPESLNYGGIGMIIGHEITHAFDANGRSFDGTGKMVDWWTNTTNAQFAEKAQCFVDQYSQFNITAGNKTLPVNGKLTLSENIADNGGLLASFLAFQTLQQSTKKSERLQGLEQLSPEALFFVNFGRTWCAKQRDAVVEQLIYIDNHSPNQFRVNGAIQNSNEFSTIFNCPVGSPMNPANKCKMW